MKGTGNTVSYLIKAALLDARPPIQDYNNAGPLEEKGIESRKNLIFDRFKRGLRHGERGRIIAS